MISTELTVQTVQYNTVSYTRSASKCQNKVYGIMLRGGGRGRGKSQ